MKNIKVIFISSIYIINSFIVTYLLGIKNVLSLEGILFNFVITLISLNVLAVFYLLSLFILEVLSVFFKKNLKHKVYNKLFSKNDKNKNYDSVDKIISNAVKSNNMLTFLLTIVSNNEYIEEKNNYNDWTEIFGRYVDYEDFTVYVFLYLCVIGIFNFFAIIGVIASAEIPISFFIHNSILFGIIIIINSIYILSSFHEGKKSILKNIQYETIYQTFENQRKKLIKSFGIEESKLYTILKVSQLTNIKIKKDMLKEINSKLIKISKIVSLLKEEDIDNSMIEKIKSEIDIIHVKCQEILNSYEEKERKKKEKDKEEEKNTLKEEELKKSKEEKERKLEIKKTLKEL